MILSCRSLLAAVFLVLFASSLRADLSVRAAKPSDAGVEVQARGPVHEAFAQLTLVNAAPTPLVAKDPPKPLPEQPPDQKPEGDNMQWVPGYWAWDADQKDFTWISGIWRAPPAQRQWVPGHWGKGDDGWQWVPGFWADSSRGQLDYLPKPPNSQDTGPSAPAPNDGSFYVPGVWLPMNGRFTWRPGFWAPYKAERIWIPSHYAWTPGGYVFVSGYWDYPLETRGLLFAPARFAQPLWDDPSWSYQPGYVVGIDPLLNSLWAYPGLGWYAFGNYYGPGYGRLGYRPWHAYGQRFHDPLYGYYRWSNRGNPAWSRNVQAGFLARQNGTAALPPRTLAAQLANAKGPQMLTALNQARNPNFRMAGLSTGQRAAQRTAAQRLQTFGQARSQREAATGRSLAAASRNGAPLRLPASGAALRRTGPVISSGSGRPIASSIRNYYSPSGFRGTTAGIGMRSAPTFRSAPSFSRSMSSFRGSAGSFRGGARGGGGGHRR